MTTGQSSGLAPGQSPDPSPGLAPVLDLGSVDGPVLCFGGPYSNVQATDAMLARARALGLAPQQIVCTGDVVAYAGDPVATVERVRDAGIRVVMGNCEEPWASTPLIAAAAGALRAVNPDLPYAETFETGLWPNMDVMPESERRERRRPLAPGSVLWPEERIAAAK